MKRVLLIDDQDQNNALEVIKSLYNDENNLETFWFNPVDREYLTETGNLDIELSLSNMMNKYFTKKIDLVGCDINLGATNKTTAFKVIKKIREYDKCCTIILYSGGLTKQLLQYFNDQPPTEGEQLIRAILSAEIRKITSRTVLNDIVLELLDQPSIQLQVLDFLETHIDLKIQNKYGQFRGKSLKEIAREVQCQTIDGIAFTKEILEQGFSLLIDINSN